MAVVAAKGLLAVVSTVGKVSCEANLVWSPQVTVGATIDNDAPQAGLLKGDLPETMRLDYLDSTAKAAVGDNVVTSGYSLKIPKGIPIGKIIAIESDPDFGRRRAKVAANVRLVDVAEVWVIK